jgi:hypothetical protein
MSRDAGRPKGMIMFAKTTKALVAALALAGVSTAMVSQASAAPKRDDDSKKCHRALMSEAVAAGRAGRPRH